MSKKSSSSIKEALGNLTFAQREAILSILKRLQDGTKLKSDDVGLLGMDLSAVNITFVASFFHVTQKAIRDWKDLGCPHGRDGTYSLYEIYEWRLARAIEKATSKGGGLKDQKLQKEIDFLQAKMDKINEEYILRKEANERYAAFTVAVRSVIEKSHIKNAHEFVGLTTEEANYKLPELGRAILNKLGGI